MARYERGELSDRDMHAVERLMLDSEFESEAMEGMESISAEEFEEDLSILQQKLDQRTATKGSSAAWWWRVAAVIVLAISAGIFLVYQNNPTPTQLAENVSPLSEPESDEQEPDTDQQFSNVTADPETPSAEAPEAEPEQTEQAVEEDLQEKKTDDRLALSETTRPAAARQKDTREMDGASVARSEESQAGQEKPDLNAVPRMAVDSSLDRKLPAMDIDVQEQELIGVIKGEKFTLITPSAGRPGEQLHGRVYDLNGVPVQGANVTIKGLNQSLTTNLDGEFELDIEEVEDDKMILSYIGMRSQGLEVTNQDSLFIMLEEDEDAELGEIVLEDETKPGNNVIYRGAGPAGGTINFSTYLQENAQALSNDSTEVEVLVIFTVNTDGSLLDFKVRKSPDASYTAEAIRLIKEGPAWLPALQDGSPVRDRVRVRIPFN